MKTFLHNQNLSRNVNLVLVLAELGLTLSHQINAQFHFISKENSPRLVSALNFKSSVQPNTFRSVIDWSAMESVPSIHLLIVYQQCVSAISELVMGPSKLNQNLFRKMALTTQFIHTLRFIGAYFLDIDCDGKNFKGNNLENAKILLEIAQNGDFEIEVPHIVRRFRQKQKPAFEQTIKQE
jgi:hypothetical protein